MDMGLYDRDYMRAGNSDSAPGWAGNRVSRRKARNTMFVVMAIIVLLALVIAFLI